MMKKCRIVVIAALAAAFFAADVAAEGFLEWITPYRGPHKDVITLIVTGNYTKSRLMAELVQHETRQPILLLPAQPGGKLFFMPSKGNALEVENEQFSRFVKFANAKQILVLGDSNFVPESYVGRIDNTQTVIRVKNRDWNEIAVTVSEMLDLSNLRKDYKRLSRQIESGKLFEPEKRSAKRLPPVTTPPPPAGPIAKDFDIVEPDEPAPTGDIMVEEEEEEPILIKDTDIVPK